jgi:hypothetical protein
LPLSIAPQLRGVSGNAAHRVVAKPHMRR